MNTKCRLKSGGTVFVDQTIWGNSIEIHAGSGLWAEAVLEEDELRWLQSAITQMLQKYAGEKEVVTGVHV